MKKAIACWLNCAGVIYIFYAHLRHLPYPYFILHDQPNYVGGVYIISLFPSYIFHSCLLVHSQPLLLWWILCHKLLRDKSSSLFYCHKTMWSLVAIFITYITSNGVAIFFYMSNMITSPTFYRTKYIFILEGVNIHGFLMLFIFSAKCNL